MADKFEKVSAGDALNFSADWFNAVTDATRLVQSRNKGKNGAGWAGDPLVPATLIWVKNTAGGSLLSYSPVISSGATPIDPTSKPQNARRCPVVEVIAPLTEADSPFITLGPIAEGKLGLAATLGVTVAQVNVTDDTHRFAVCEAGNTTALVSAVAGPVQILGPYDTGNLSRLVLLTGRGDNSEGATGQCATACGSLVGMREDWCLKFSVICKTGEFAALDASQTAYMRFDGGAWTAQVWDTEAEDWVDWTFDYVGGSGDVVFYFDGTEPTLEIDGIPLRLRCLSGDATFSGGPAIGFTGDPEATVDICEGNDFTVRIECACCSIDGWGGPGWYCLDTGDGCPGEAFELTEDDRCDPDLQGLICSGPYDTQEDAEADCPPPVPSIECSECEIPKSGLTMSLTGTGIFSAVNGQDIQLEYDDDLACGWFGVNGGGFKGKMACESEVLNAIFAQPADFPLDCSSHGVSMTIDTCSPFSASGGLDLGGGDAYTITVHE